MILQTIAPNSTIVYDFHKQRSPVLVDIMPPCIIANGLIKIYSTFRIIWVAIATLFKLVISIKGKKGLMYVLVTVLILYNNMHKKTSSAPILFLFHRISRFRMAGSGLGWSLSLLDVAELRGETDRSSSLQPLTTASSSLLDVRERTGTLRRFETRTSTRLVTPRATTQSGSACIEEGLALLGDGTSCIEQLEHEDHSVDNSILDYESDGSDPDLFTPQAADKLPLSTAMETDVERVAAVPQEFDATVCTTNVNLLDLLVKRTLLSVSPRTTRSGGLSQFNHLSLARSRITVTLLILIMDRGYCGEVLS